MIVPMNSTPSSVLPSAAIGSQRRSERTTTVVVSVAHSYSHFAHLMVAPLFPWLQPAFDLSYSELGLLMTVFFLVSGICQALSGFTVRTARSNTSAPTHADISNLARLPASIASSRWRWIRCGLLQKSGWPRKKRR